VTSFRTTPPGDTDLGRNDLGELCDRQRLHRDEPGQHGDDRDDDGNDWTADEEA
jgi:hypothetical protein